MSGNKGHLFFLFFQAWGGELWGRGSMARKCLRLEGGRWRRKGAHPARAQDLSPERTSAPSADNCSMLSSFSQAGLSAQSWVGAHGEAALLSAGAVSCLAATSDPKGDPELAWANRPAGPPAIGPRLHLGICCCELMDMAWKTKYRGELTWCGSCSLGTSSQLSLVVPQLFLCLALPGTDGSLWKLKIEPDIRAKQFWWGCAKPNQITRPFLWS